HPARTLPPRLPFRRSRFRTSRPYGTEASPAPSHATAPQDSSLQKSHTRATLTSLRSDRRGPRRGPRGARRGRGAGRARGGRQAGRGPARRARRGTRWGTRRGPAEPAGPGRAPGGRAPGGRGPAGQAGGRTWADSGLGTPRSVVIASRVDWYTNRSRLGLARNRAAAAIGAVAPGPSPSARDSATAACAVL